MFNHSDNLRVMAAEYLRLAKDTKDPAERSKFFDYARAYAQLSEQVERRETMAGEMRSVEMFPNRETLSHDLTVDEASSTLQWTADCFERRAATTADKEEREALLDYAKHYRDMAKLRDQSDAEVDDESM